MAECGRTLRLWGRPGRTGSSAAAIKGMISGGAPSAGADRNIRHRKNAMV